MDFKLLPAKILPAPFPARALVERQLLEALRERRHLRRSVSHVLKVFRRRGGPILTGATYRHNSAVQSYVTRPEFDGKISPQPNPAASALAALLGRPIHSSDPGAVRFCPGSSHFILSQLGEIPPENAECAETLMLGLSHNFPQAEIRSEPFTDGSFDGVLVCAGGPASNALTRTALNYGMLTDNFSDGFFRQELPFNLRFDILHDVRRVQREFGMSRRAVGSEKFETQNWPVFDAYDEKYFVSGVDNSGLQSDDYLLISSIPNTMLPHYDPTSRVTIFAGCHGAGTKAAALLLDRPVIMEHLQREVGVGYWQALLHVKCHVDRHSEVITPVDIEIVEIFPISVSERAIEAWLDANVAEVYIEAPQEFGEIQTVEGAELALLGCPGSASFAPEVGAMNDDLPSDTESCANILVRGLAEVVSNRPELILRFMATFDARRAANCVLEAVDENPLERTFASLLGIDPRALGKLDGSAMALPQGGSLKEAGHCLTRLTNAVRWASETQPWILSVASETMVIHELDPQMFLTELINSYCALGLADAI